MIARPKVLRAVVPNAGIRAAYRKKLESLIEDMAASYGRWLKAQYRETPPRLAQDATPAAELDRELKRLGMRWRRRFNEAAPKLARWFSRSVEARSNRVLRKILRDGGISVEFQMTQGMRDVAAATVAENVHLIKSIAAQYHTEVQGLVMRSVTAGRKLDELSKELRQRYGITKRRAEFIARDQSNKATATFTRVRQMEAGIEYAVWLHSAGGKTPRPTHVKNSGKRYKISEGWLDPAINKRIWPGTEPNCRCVPKPIIPGFS